MEVKVKVITKTYFADLPGKTEIVGVIPKDCDPFSIISTDKAAVIAAHPNVDLVSAQPPVLAKLGFKSALVNKGTGSVVVAYNYPEVFTVDIPELDKLFELSKEDIGCLLYVLGAEIGRLRAVPEESGYTESEIEIYKDLAFRLNGTAM